LCFELLDLKKENFTHGERIMKELFAIMMRVLSIRTTLRRSRSTKFLL